MSPLKAARLLLLAIFALTPDGVMATNNTEAGDFLTKYGYLGESTKTTTEDDMKNAIKDFQGFVGLNITGQLDDATVGMMKAPRCGVKDRRFVTVTSWNHSDVTYFFQNYSPDLDDPLIEEIIRAAFDQWQDVTNINFAKESVLPADIIIQFGAADHGDLLPFDGPGGVLGHAFYPQDGDTHFDEDETWTHLTNTGINLFQFAVHQFGHAIGLGHSTVVGAVMFPVYCGYMSEFMLHYDDIAGAQDVYGPRTGTPVNPPICQNPVIDAITQQPDGFTYVFQGTDVYKLQKFARRSKAGYPKLITQEFRRAPNNLDATITFGGRTFFLKGGRAFTFKGKNYKRKLVIRKRFPGVPRFIDAAFTSSKIQYFLKGANIFKHNPRRHKRHRTTKKRIKKFVAGAPNGIDAAGRHNGVLYFFKGNQYYRVDETKKGHRLKIADGYPKPTVPDWFGCP